MKEKLYNFPQYYDVAFSWDISREIKFFQELFTKYVPFEEKNILEPACGTGRFLVKLPEYGYHITGYDNNPKMLIFAKKRIIDAGLQNIVTVEKKNMKSAKFKIKFDAAINSINSIGYLLSDEDILSHFKNTGESLKSKGIYILHLACACDHPEFQEKPDDSWILEKEGIKIKTTWLIDKYDIEKKISYQTCKMEIDDHGKQTTLEDHHILRLWFFEDIKSLIRKSEKFKLEAIYDEKHKQISLDTHISGELGNLYYIFKAL